MRLAQWRRRRRLALTPRRAKTWKKTLHDQTVGSLWMMERRLGVVTLQRERVSTKTATSENPLFGLGFVYGSFRLATIELSRA